MARTREYDDYPSMTVDPSTLTFRQRRRLRNATSLAPRWYQRLRSLIVLVVLIAALGAALAAIVGTILIAGGFVLERVMG